MLSLCDLTTSPNCCHPVVHTLCWYLLPRRWVSPVLSVTPATSPDHFHAAIPTVDTCRPTVQRWVSPLPPHQTAITSPYMYPPSVDTHHPTVHSTKVSQPSAVNDPHHPTRPLPRCCTHTVNTLHLALQKWVSPVLLSLCQWHISPSPNCCHTLPCPPSVDTHHPTVQRWVSPVFITGSVPTTSPPPNCCPTHPLLIPITPQYTGESALFLLLGQWQPPSPTTNCCPTHPLLIPSPHSTQVSQPCFHYWVSDNPPPPPQTAALPTLCWYHHPTVHGWVSPVLSQCHWLHHLITTVFSYSPHPTPHWHPSGDLSPHSKDVTVLLLHFCCRVPH